jgi:hypothetical protein
MTCRIAVVGAGRMGKHAPLPAGVRSSAIAPSCGMAVSATCAAGVLPVADVERTRHGQDGRATHGQDARATRRALA